MSLAAAETSCKGQAKEAGAYHCQTGSTMNIKGEGAGASAAAVGSAGFLGEGKKSQWKVVKMLAGAEIPVWELVCCFQQSWGGGVEVQPRVPTMQVPLSLAGQGAHLAFFTQPTPGC